MDIFGIVQGWRPYVIEPELSGAIAGDGAQCLRAGLPGSHRRGWGGGRKPLVSSGQVKAAFLERHRRFAHLQFRDEAPRHHIVGKLCRIAGQQMQLAEDMLIPAAHYKSLGQFGMDAPALRRHQFPGAHYGVRFERGQ